ncbi:hypothetical protein R6Q59_026563 [Mikania micrantha]
MADVMQGCGHGRDGAEDPPPPRVAPPRKTRCEAKNKKLTHAVSQSRGSLTIPFDANATFTPVGKLNDWFTREMRIYMWDYLLTWMRLSVVTKCAQKKGVIETTLLKRYRDQKAMAKQHFIKNGGYDDEERVRANPPEGMSAEN